MGYGYEEAKRAIKSHLENNIPAAIVCVQIRVESSEFGRAYRDAVKEIQEDKERRRLVLEERKEVSDRINKINEKISAVVLAVGIPVVAIFHYFDLF